MTSQKQTRFRCNAAFTLIELGVVVFIMAVLGVMAMPYFARSYRSMLLKDAARSFANTCQLARYYAVLDQREITLHLSVDRQVFWLTGSAGSEDDKDIDGETSGMLKIVKLPRDVQLIEAELHDDLDPQRRSVEMGFYPNGTCDHVTVLFRGKDKDGSIFLEVDPVTGRAMPGKEK